jgi:hypothetical protein
LSKIKVHQTTLFEKLQMQLQQMVKNRIFLIHASFSTALDSQIQISIDRYTLLASGFDGGDGAQPQPMLT